VTGPYRDGKVHVLSQMCATCVGRPGNLMKLGPGRLREVVEGNLEEGVALPCHSTTYEQDPRGESLCRWFVDTYGDRVYLLRLAAAMGILQEDDPPPSR
jgi:hypothetical protein